MEQQFHELLDRCRQRRVTDLLLREGEPLRCRIRDQIQSEADVISEELMAWLFGIGGAGQVRETGSDTLDSDSAYEWNGRYRINRFTAQGKLCASIRIIAGAIPGLAELGVDERLPSMIHQHRGLSLIVGKTGSGKSTTMAGILAALLAAWPWHVITLEDPVEYHLPAGAGLVTQRELGRDFLSFQEGIRSALRQSPDLLMIGEIRDTASMRSVLAAAESGIGVIATLHSLGAATTLSRILQMFPGTERDFVRFQIAENLNFIQSQVLRRESGGLKLDYELLLGSQAVKNTIREGHFNQLGNLIFLGQRQGMHPFDPATVR